MVTGTVRRFLEHYGDNIDVVVFVADSEEVRGHMTIIARTHTLPFPLSPLSRQCTTIFYRSISHVLKRNKIGPCPIYQLISVSHTHFILGYLIFEP